MKTRLPRTVIVLGFVSLFNDLASEMIVPLIPILLAGVLGAGPIALGLIEGVADAVASFLKLWSGRHSDRLGGRRKALTLGGYVLSNIARPLLAFAGSWGLVLVLRSVDRVGKGLRSAPRDALVADATPAQIKGYAYGFHRALDNSGAVGGSLIAAAMLAWSGLPLAQVVLFSAIPGFLAVLLIAVGVHEPPAAKVAPRRTLAPLRWKVLSRGMRRYLLVLAVFTFARASETFIVLLGYQMGIGVVELLMLWAALNFAKALTSAAGGRLADTMGRGPLMLLSWTAFAACFLLLGKVNSSVSLWTVTIAYGLFFGLGEGAEKALISDLAGPAEQGTAFGWYYLVLGLAAIPAGLLFGAVWHYQSAAMAFFLAAGIAAVAVLLLRGWAWPIRQEPLMS
ncbi:MAG TPA: MFS transporter [Burkholderiales bacterium]|nr:MFS transporter [Burkholderiales bacterium]